MAWQVSGDMFELCSCNILCPCWLGPETKPDKGWCSGVLAFDIQRGAVEGVDVAGRKVVLAAEWPGNFFGGNGTARLYIDDRANADQRRELEAVFTGRKGGFLEGLFGAVISRWLAAQTTEININRNGSISIRVGRFGQATLKPLRDESGRPVSIQGTAAQAAFQSANMEVASSQGSRWTDSDLRGWEGDSGTIHKFDWRS
jgi:hypothetical protein